MEYRKPVRRSKIRIQWGKIFYTGLRYLTWYFGNKKYAEYKTLELLPYVSFTHKTPLYRKLKQVDMWMQRNKVINLQIAVDQINGIVIRPG